MERRASGQTTYSATSTSSCLSDELESFIEDNKHLPGIPAADVVDETGIAVDAMQQKTMEKLEELTLYVLELNKQNKELQARIQQLEKGGE